jgi:hypothetical protein
MGLEDAFSSGPTDLALATSAGVHARSVRRLRPLLGVAQGRLFGGADALLTG